MQKVGVVASSIIACFFAIKGDAQQDLSGKTILFHGNEFLMSTRHHLADTVIDPVTEVQIIKTFQHRATPVAMNGEPIYHYAEVCRSAEPRRHRHLEEYVLDKLTPRLSMLADGTYFINVRDVVADRNGSVVYYKLDSISRRTKDSTEWHHEFYTYFDKVGAIDARTAQYLANDLQAIMMSAPSLRPAKYKGKSVAYMTEVRLSDFTVFVQDHKVSYAFMYFPPMHDQYPAYRPKG